MIALPHDDVTSALIGPDSAASACVVAWDTETWRIAPGRLAPPLVCVSLAWRDRAGRLVAGLYSRNVGAGVVRRLVKGPILVAHNAAYDTAVLLAHLGPGPAWDLVFDAYNAGKMACTAVREALLHVAAGRANRFDPPISLEASALRLLNESIEGKRGPNAWRLRYYELDGVPLEHWPADAVDYARSDAAYCLRVYEAQAVELDPIPDEEPQTRKAFAVRLQDARGFRCDSDRVWKYGAELDRRIGAAAPALEKAGLLVAGTKKDKATRALVCKTYDRHGLGRPPLTRKGRELVENLSSADSLYPEYAQAGGDVLREVPCESGACVIYKGSIEEPCDEVLHVLSWRQDAVTEQSRFLRHLERGVREVVNARTRPVLATGRTSVSDPPYQQAPRRPGARECIVPRPGYLFVGADWSAAELVTLAQTCLEWVGWSRLAKTLNAGFDPHLQMAAAELGAGYDDALGRCDRGDQDVIDARQRCKAANFGFPGGMGPRAFVSYAWRSWGVRVTEEHARRMKQLWYRNQPEMRIYLDLVSRWCDAGGGAFTLQQPYSGRLRGEVGYCDGCNSPFQGRAADAFALAIWRVTEECWLPSARSPLLGARPVLSMHDEIICEAREDRAAGAAERLSAVMVEALAEVCPDMRAACRADPWVAHRWSKGAKTVRDADSRLIPWD